MMVDSACEIRDLAAYNVSETELCESSTIQTLQSEKVTSQESSAVESKPSTENGLAMPESMNQCLQLGDWIHLSIKEKEEAMLNCQIPLERAKSIPFQNDGMTEIRTCYERIQHEREIAAFYNPGTRVFTDMRMKNIYNVYPTIAVAMVGCEFVALLDSGATDCCISTGTLCHLPLAGYDIEKFNSEIICKTAGEPVQSPGRLSLWVKWPKGITCVDFTVLPNEEHLILLGQTFMIANYIDLHGREKAWSVKGDPATKTLYSDAYNSEVMTCITLKDVGIRDLPAVSYAEGNPKKLAELLKKQKGLFSNKLGRCRPLTYFTTIGEHPLAKYLGTDTDDKRDIVEASVRLVLSLGKRDKKNDDPSQCIDYRNPWKTSGNNLNCPVCDGKGFLLINMYWHWCKNCNGTGKKLGKVNVSRDSVPVKDYLLPPPRIPEKANNARFQPHGYPEDRNPKRKDSMFIESKHKSEPVPMLHHPRSRSIARDHTNGRNVQYGKIMPATKRSIKDPDSICREDIAAARGQARAREQQQRRELTCEIAYDSTGRPIKRTVRNSIVTPIVNGKKFRRRNPEKKREQNTNPHHITNTQIGPGTIIRTSWVPRSSNLLRRGTGGEPIYRSYDQLQFELELERTRPELTPKGIFALGRAYMIAERKRRRRERQEQKEWIEDRLWI